MRRLLSIGLVLVTGCASDDGDPPWDPGDPLPAPCSGASGLETRIDESVFLFDGTIASASRATTSVSSPLTLAQPWQILELLDAELASGVIALPDDRVRISYSMNPNGSELVDNIHLDTEPPAAANWYHAAVEGTLAFAQAGILVGERRCGWIDATLRWMPVGDAERSLRLRAAFDATVEPILTDR